ncbi:hypothetical protein GCM10018775_26230 [Streptomyces umbrinus]|nr:hypothetical protein GCM10018775_26230 [Streptomyces umbrinus]
MCRPSRRQATDSGWTWAQTAALIVPCIALLGAFLTYARSQRVVRREHRAKSFAEALTAVEEYLEMPYRIRCRPDSSSAVQQQLTDEVSSLLARMAFHQAWLQIEGQQYEPRTPVPPGPVERSPRHVHRGDASTPVTTAVILVPTIPLLCQLKILVTPGYRRTLGMPRPIHEMISRWISLLPPPKVKITAER